MNSDSTDGSKASDEPPEPYLVIEPVKGVFSIDWQELWNYRELLWFLVWRDVLVRYKQTVLGAAWAVLQPLSTMLVLTLFFGRLAKIPSDGLPYPLFSYSALLLWTFFSSTLNFAARSLVSNQNIVTKLYFPRVTMPAAPVIGGLLDLAIASLLMFVLMAFYGMYPTIRIVALPVMVNRGFCGHPGRGPVSGGHEREISGFPFCGAFSDAVLDVCQPRGLSCQHDTGKVEDALFPESHGRGH